MDIDQIPIWLIFFYSVLPIAGLFILERAFLYYLIKKNDIEWVQQQKWLHPNFISRCRYPTGFLSILFFHVGWEYFSIIWFGFWMITDLTDGTIARYFKLYTPEGESIDPLSDKLLYFPPLFYLAYLGLYPMWPVFFFLIFDITGQASRGFIKNKAANLYGKAKTFMAVITLISATLQQAYFSHLPPLTVTTYLLGGTVFLSFCSTFFKIIPNYWYANILSLLNFLCGILGIAFITMGYRPEIAFGLVFLGQFLDLFDGRAAERWGSTPRGELFDDLADGTNFGGTIAFIIYAALELSGNSLLGLIFGVLHFSCTTYRLIRFISNKRKAGIDGGVSTFQGLPSPAGALVAGSGVLFFHGFPIAQICIVALSSFLMISKFPYIHFGRVILPAIPKSVKVLVLTLFLVVVFLAITTTKNLQQNLDNVILGIFVVSIGYSLMGLPYPFLRKKNAKSSKKQGKKRLKGKQGKQGKR